MSVVILAELARLVKQPVYKHFTKLRRNDFHRLASSASLATVATLTTKMGFWSIKTQTELNQSRNECVTNKMGFSRVAVAGVQPDILCGSKGLGGAESELQAGLILDNRPKSKRRAGKDSPKRVGSGLGGAAPPVKRSATPLFGLHESVAVTLKARAQRGTRVGRRPKDALAYVLRAGESRFLAAGRQVMLMTRSRIPAEVVLSGQTRRSATSVLRLALASAGYRKQDVEHLKQHQPDCLWRIHFVHKKWIGCSK